MVFRLRSEMHVRGQTTIVRGHATLARLSEVIRGVSLHSLGDALDNLGYAPRELAHRGYRWTVVDFSGTLSQTPIPIIIIAAIRVPPAMDATQLDTNTKLMHMYDADRTCYLAVLGTAPD